LRKGKLSFTFDMHYSTAHHEVNQSVEQTLQTMACRTLVVFPLLATNAWTMYHVKRV